MKKINRVKDIDPYTELSSLCLDLKPLMEYCFNNEIPRYGYIISSWSAGVWIKSSLDMNQSNYKVWPLPVDFEDENIIKIIENLKIIENANKTTNKVSLRRNDLA